MRSWWRGRSQWPPSPCVEDEWVSLAHELNGLSLLGEKPGVEGACVRGTIDQYPIILMSEIFTSRSTSADSNPSVFSTHGSRSLKESFSPPTPPTTANAASRSQTTVPKQSCRDQRYEPCDPSIGPPLQSRPVRTPQSYRPGGGQAPSYNDTIDGRPTQPDFESRSKGRPNGQNLHAFSSDESHRRPTTNGDSSNGSNPGGLSNPASRPQLWQLPNTNPQRPIKRPTVAERIEEKLKRRKEQQASGPDNGVPSANTTSTHPVNSPSDAADTASKTLETHLEGPPTTAVVSRNAPESSVHNPRLDSAALTANSSDQGPEPQAPPPEGPNSARNSSPNAADTAPTVVAAQDRTVRKSTAPPPKADLPPRSSSCGEAPSSTPAQDRRGVSFADNNIQHTAPPMATNGRSRSRPPASHQNLPTSGAFPSIAEDISSLCLRPCPRPIPEAGHQDWYTIAGLSHLDICPSCMKQIGQSRFRDFFVSSLPKPRETKVRCSFSEPWTRLAWLQTIKKKLSTLEMLYEVTRPPSGWKLCPGRKASIQAWYRVVDPETGMNLPGFNACSTCVRNVRILMPALRDTFRSSPLVQERFCDLAVDSPRFVQYLDLLDAAANRFEYEVSSRPDIRSFVSYIQRKCELHDCRRDRLILSTWYYIPQLPELTICEDCYDDVVWPLASARKPIAKMVSRSPRLLPGSGPSRCREASCQLYSPRMRAKFREAVQKEDFTYLKAAALRRYDAERTFRERKQMLLDQESRGYDCDAELRRNAQEWKKWE